MPGSEPSSEASLDRDAVQARLRAICAPAARLLSRASGLATLAALLWLAQAALVADVISGLVLDRDPWLGLWLSCAGFAVLGLTRVGLSTVSARMAHRAADRAVAALRHDLLRRSAVRAAQGAATVGSAEIAALVSEKAASLTPYLTRYRPAMARTMVMPPVILAVALSMSWAVAGILLVAGPLIPVFMALVGYAAREASERQMQEIGSLNALVLERINALVDIRLLDAGARTLAGFQGAADRLRARTMEVLRIAFLSSAVLELFAALGVAMVAVYVGFALLGEFTFGAYATPLTVWEGVFLLLLAPEFFQPLRDLASAWHDKAAASAVAGEVARLEAEEGAEILGHGAGADPLPGAADIALSGVRVAVGGAFGSSGSLSEEIAYPDIAISGGERIALVGPSGSGKSTLLAVMAGLRAPSGGTVRVAGHALSAETADAWRARVAWIGQTPHFLNASLRANLRLGAAEASPDTLARALEAARGRGIVAALPRGLATRIGESGHGVSGGEARRLMIARGLAADRDVVFADEPTADLDAATAEAVAEGLLALAARGATLVVATHDMRLAARMDRVVRLEGGA
ncbi:thiol reductant ABC exporter subunit CydD [Stappia sp.]|uniref:thiol reductant ABC exporter subunit CydD n=1 Tax=Stappia sp. TaxID=1870903 RepID=UPI0032D9A667